MNPAVGQTIETITTWLQLIVTIGAVVSLFYALSKFASTPNRTQDQRLDTLEKWKEYEFMKWKEKIENRLEVGNSHFKKQDEGNQVTQKALLALIDHSLNGNNVHQLEEAKEQLTNYLTQ